MLYCKCALRDSRVPSKEINMDSIVNAMSNKAVVLMLGDSLPIIGPNHLAEAGA
jgi:hypothetical protein